jgi:hypothetical protein
MYVHIGTLLFLFVISPNVHNCTDARPKCPYDRVVIRWDMGACPLWSDCTR